jgi:transcriptional regulator with XRE-family HTH domain
MEIKIIIGHRIKQLREKNGMSQKDLAFDSDLDRSYIASVENGQRNISIVNITKIATALKVSLKEFFNDDEFNHTTGSPE